MNPTDDLDELMMCRLNTVRKAAEPCVIVILGASGDLTARKLIPALYHSFKNRLMPASFQIIGFARREKTDEAWRAELRSALDQFSRTQPVDNGTWYSFSSNLSYCQGDFTDPAGYVRLRQRLESLAPPELQRNRLFYLAASPSQFAPVVEELHRAGLLGREEGAGWQRVVVEKPFGRDLASAQMLNAALTRFVREQQIYRIDHYLGKETVQNIMLFRFANSLFERVWHRDMVDHVQITVSEKAGVAGRGGYYEEAGALRDMVQNHLLQVLSLVAMEPPVSLDAEAIRDEKVKLLKSIRVLLPGQVAHHVARGQYEAGLVAERPQPGYRQEPRVKPESNVETFVALKLFVDNWRWSGVPFYLRTGKCLPLSASEVRLQFRAPPSVLFAAACGPRLDPNSLTLRLQPQEGITLRFNGKVPGVALSLRPMRMHFSYDAAFGAYTPEAYERLLLDAMAGDATLFIRRDEVETAWRIADAIRAGWEGRPLARTEFYRAGTWGPPAADELLSRGGHAWRHPQTGS